MNPFEIYIHRVYTCTRSFSMFLCKCCTATLSVGLHLKTGEKSLLDKHRPYYSQMYFYKKAVKLNQDRNKNRKGNFNRILYCYIHKHYICICPSSDLLTMIKIMLLTIMRHRDVTNGR